MCCLRSFPQTRVAVTVALALATTACLSGGGRRVEPVPSAPGTPASSPLEGEWRLVALHLADGASRRVTGSLRYDRFATISVKAELAADEPAARPPRTVIADFTAKAQPQDGQFTFAALSSGTEPERLSQEAVSMGEWRHYELAGDTLRVSVRDSGGRATATLVFERVR